MSDTPFAPFQPAAAPSPQQMQQPAETAKPKRGRKPKPEGTAAAEPKRRSASPKVAGARFELSAILGVAAALNQEDYPLFEKLVDALNEAGKPARERLLKALAKIFG